MSKKTIDKDLQSIKFNAFSLAPLILSFFKECQVSNDNVLLAYLVLPLIYSEKWSSLNYRINTNSNIGNWIVQDKMPVNGLNERMYFFQDFTTTILQYCFDRKWAVLDSYNNVRVQNVQEWDKPTDATLKYASKINNLFQGMSVAQIYSSLGIDKLCLHV